MARLSNRLSKHIRSDHQIEMGCLRQGRNEETHLRVCIQHRYRSTPTSLLQDTKIRTARIIPNPQIDTTTGGQGHHHHRRRLRTIWSPSGISSQTKSRSCTLERIHLQAVRIIQEPQLSHKTVPVLHPTMRRRSRSTR